ncbi:MAG: hypothetical protein BWY17_04880 [Deltaproteobacteria bacterium ADurb.Bin207]|jgi:hypothetical protein|nr:MAG: hypothetical protein BWY17_04880 [Deltaproteobacteria bacterium ADurb.Bin207]
MGGMQKRFTAQGLISFFPTMHGGSADRVDDLEFDQQNTHRTEWTAKTPSKGWVVQGIDDVGMERNRLRIHRLSTLPQGCSSVVLC